MRQFTSVEDLVGYVEGLPYHQRYKVLMEVGRTSLLATPPESTTLQNIICTMAQVSQVHYHRLLAAYAVRGAFAAAKCHSTCVAESLWQAALTLLADPSTKVAELVMTSLLTAEKTGVKPPQTSAVFSPLSFAATAPLPQFKCFVLKLRQCGQDDLLVHLYADSAIGDPVKRQLLFGLLPPAVVEKLPEEEQASLNFDALRLLCRFHGCWVAQYLTRRVEAQLSVSPTVNAMLKQHVLMACTYLFKYGATKDALALFTATAHLLGVDQCEVTQLLSRYLLCAFPIEVGEYLTNGKGRKMLDNIGRPLQCSLSRRAVKRLSGQTDLILLMMERGVLRSAREAPSFAPAEVRQRLYDTQRTLLTEDNGVMSSYSIKWLPRSADRTTEARINFKHRALQDDPYSRISYLCFLPFPEALSLGNVYVTSNDVNLRGDCVASLLRSLTYFPEYVEAALDFCLKRTKERDPWRKSMLAAWYDLPREFWHHTTAFMNSEELVEKLQQLIDATYSAKDVSDSTLYNVQELLCSLLCSHTEFAVAQLLQLIDKRKRFDAVIRIADTFAYLAEKHPQALSKAATQMIGFAQQLLQNNNYDGYAGILRAFLPTERLCVARSLLCNGRDAAQQARMQELVKVALQAGIDCSDHCTARSAFTMLHRIFPADTAAGLPDLLEKNLDWVTQDEVQMMVCSVLQGPLLDRLVAPISNIPVGRFYDSENKNPAYLCRLPLSHAYRWTARQQQRYAESILQLIYGENNMTMFKVSSFVSSLALLPSVSSTTAWKSPEGVSYSLLTLATENHSKHKDYLKGFALHALGRLQGDAAAPTVLQAALDDPATRMEALRALTRTLRRASTPEAIRVLEPLLTGKQVTAQKEALNLLGSKQDEVAYQRLVRFALEQRLPMPDVDAEGNILRSTAAATGDLQLQQQLSSSSQQAPAPQLSMHRDVRTAFVTTLFHYVAKPQVWAYYDRLVEWDCTGTETKDGEGSGAAAVKQVDDDHHSNNDGAAPQEEQVESEGLEEATKNKHCPSAAACEALTTLSWVQLHLPWQHTRYQTLLMRLLKHPERRVCVAALHKLASVPPYSNMELFQAAASYLEECANFELVQSALKCMMRCTSEETVPCVVSAILSIQSDSSLQFVTSVLTFTTYWADAATRLRYYGVVKSVVQHLVVARRQPTVIVQLIYILPASEWVSQLTELNNAGLLHFGAAYSAVKLVRSNCTLLHDKTEVEALEESTLRNHELPVLRRVGLEVVLQMGRNARWTSKRRTAVEAYQKDSDAWVSFDALMARMQ